MPRQDEIDRMIVMLYRSRNAHGHVNYVRPASWMDKLAMAGLEELRADFERMAGEVLVEIEKRKADGIPTYSREYHEDQEAERSSGAALLAEIGIESKEQNSDG